MLDYFNTRQQQSQKSPLIRKPYITYGISIQTPKQFQKPWTMMSGDTFVNPYLSYQKNRKTLIPVKKSKDINPVWTNKIDINQIQTQRTFLKKDNQLGFLPPQTRYYKQLSTSKTRFRLTRGEFSNFLERNHTNTLFGPLQGKQRDRSKSMLTKNEIARKSHYKISLNFDKLTQYGSKFMQIEQPFSEKHLLEKTRSAFRQGYKRQLEQRRVKNAQNYVLPHLNKSYSNMKYTIDTQAQKKSENPEFGMLSNKSIERLNQMRDFTYTQRFFTLDARRHHGADKKEQLSNTKQQ